MKNQQTNSGADQNTIVSWTSDMPYTYNDRQCYTHGYHQALAGAKQNNPFEPCTPQHINYNQDFCDGDNERIKKLPLSKFGQWYNGDIHNLGNFESHISKTWMIASCDNREKLMNAFPEHFNERDLNFNY